MSVVGEKRVGQVTETSRKKLKVGEMAAGGSNGSLFSVDLGSGDYVRDTNGRFRAGKPYEHVVVNSVFDDGKLREIREELIGGLKADFKETDIFKVFQTGDLANISPEDQTMGNLVKLRDALYSPEFRKFIEQALDCGPLSSKIDCSCNLYPKGGHLLCHDDAIGTRCVSYILYLTDPDDLWTEGNGGALELYPVKEGAGEFGEPEATPTARVLPAWNSMMVFKVRPGVSFHSIQEVFSDGDHRLSISGWFHSDSEPENAHKASLRQLKALRGTDVCRAYTEIACKEKGDALSAETREFLQKFVNPLYLEEGSIEGIYKKFHEEGSIQLQDFLKPELHQEIQKAAKLADTEDGAGSLPIKDNMGVGNGWELIGPPHKQRYLKFSNTPQNSNSCGALMSSICQNLFQTPQFASLLYQLTGSTPNGHFSEIRRFRPGLDYTVAHYGALSEDTRLDAVLCFVDESTESAVDAWDSGEVGAFEAYLLAEEDDDENKEAADVYDLNDDEGGVLSISAASNTLNLVLRDEGLMRFLKYVSLDAPGSRWDIAMEYKLEDDNGGEEGEDAEEA